MKPNSMSVKWRSVNRLQMIEAALLQFGKWLKCHFKQTV